MLRNLYFMLGLALDISDRVMHVPEFELGMINVLEEYSRRQRGKLSGYLLKITARVRSGTCHA